MLLKLFNAFKFFDEESVKSVITKFNSKKNQINFVLKRSLTNFNEKVDNKTENKGGEIGLATNF